MAIRKKFTDEQERAFEAELLSVLRRDKDHRFNFDGKLKVYSSRYGCTLQAVNVHWDERERDLVFVGAFRGGTPVIDNSRGYPQIQHDVSIPFRECFEDLRKMAGSNEMYLISKTRKAVLDKCISNEVSFARSYQVTRSGRLDFDDFFEKDCRILDGRVPVQSVSVKDGIVSIETKTGEPVDIRDLSLRDIQRVGEQVRDLNETIREARHTYVSARSKVVLPNGTVDETDDRMGAAEGLAAVYEKGFPIRVCHGVAATLSQHFESVFDDTKHSAKDINTMIRAFRNGGKDFGFEVKPERQRSTVYKL